MLFLCIDCIKDHPKILMALKNTHYKNIFDLALYTAPSIFSLLTRSSETTKIADVFFSTV